MLEIRNVSISFRRYTGIFRQTWFSRLSHVHLNVAAGEVVALIGHSGAGKSLLAHAILGILPPNARVDGGIYYHDAKLTKAVLRRVRGSGIALLPQQTSYLDPTARAQSQVRWSASRARQNINIDHAFAKFGLPRDAAGMFPHQLSGGMARRVLMAQAMAGGAEIIIADEPTAGLDEKNVDVILQQLRRHADAGGGVLLITHDLVSTLPYADHVAVLKQGEMAGIFAASAFCGTGNALSGYARDMWRALPQNDFSADA